mgnify:CR=1 FL=1
MRVLLVDDHALFAQSLAIALSDFPSVEKFSNVRSIDEIETVLEKDSPDILLMDINLGKLSHEDGLLLARNLLKKYPDLKIVILSGYDLPVYRKEAEKLGAKGFISKDIEPDKLLRILECIENGSTYFEHTDNFIEELTETEKQVLRLLSGGVKRKEIAEQLFMSERTVSNHLQHIFEKLGVSSAIEAVTKAIQSGYLPPL